MVLKVYVLLLALLIRASEGYFDGIITKLPKAIETDEISKTCQEQFKVLLEENNLQYLIKMIDASSKLIYPGLLYSKNVDLGLYDECVEVDVTYDSGRILGQHCTGAIVSFSLPVGLKSWLNEKFILPKLNNAPLKMHQKEYNQTEGLIVISESVCLPNGCSGNDMQLIWNSLNIPVTVDFTQLSCATNETGTELDNWDIACICIFSIILALIIGSTTYDVYCEQTNRDKYDILLAFSLYTNVRKLFHITKGNKEQIQIFHGLRFISMMWVIAGHGMSIMTPTFFPVLNMEPLFNWMTKDYVMYISAGPLAVDTFFYISGFLLPYIYLKQNKNNDLKSQILNVPKLVLHRYIRLTPAVAALYIFSLGFYKHLGSGPMWFALNNDACLKYAAPLFLYIQNYYNYDDMCLLHTWYLSADMQMFLISPLLLIPTAYYLSKNGKTKRVLLGLVAFSVFTVILPLIVKFSYRDYPNNYDTHSRLCTYFIGFTFGTFMRINADRAFIIKKQKSLINFVLWIITLVVMFFVCYYYNHFSMQVTDYDSQTIFYSFMRPVWALGLSWMVYSSYHGYGGVINWFLTSRLMQIGSRLSYCVYLVHVLAISGYLLQTRQKVYFGDFFQFFSWCGYLIISLLGAIVLTLSFETPIMIIEKFLLGGGIKKIPHKSKSEKA